MKKRISINKILSLCVLALILIIVLGTFLVFVKNLFSSQNDIEKNSEFEKIEFDSKEIYKKIGKVRTATKDGIPLVISVYFPFEKADTEFYEEISVKNESLKSVISSFFLEYSLEELKSKGESFVKREILQNINKKLVLSQIQEIYFEEYVFFD